VIVIVQLLGARQHHGLTTVNPRAGLPRQGRRVPKRILIVDGHPDSATARLSHALAAAYAVGAREAGADLRIVALSGWPGAFVRSGAAFKEAPEDAFILEARAAMMWAEHVVLVFPLWLGGAEGANGPTPRLKGRSARLIVFADREAVRLEAVARIVVLDAAGRVVERPRAARAAAQHSSFRRIAEADHSAALAYAMPRFGVDAALAVERRNQGVASVRIPARVTGFARQFKADAAQGG
jgi:hypothetical protein